MDWVLAFSAGLLSFLSPCVLPLIPVYLSYIVGSSVTDLQANQRGAHVVLKTVLFVVGFSLVFIALGASVSSIGKLFAEHLDTLQRVGGVLIVVLGLHMTGLFKIKFLYREKKLLPLGNARGKAGPLLLGMAFAAGWTPCVGPILSSILIVAGSADTIGKGVLLLAVYSLGLALPLVLAAFVMGNLRGALAKVSRYLPAVSVVSGIVMIVIGILVFTNQLEAISRYPGIFNI